MEFLFFSFYSFVRFTTNFLFVPISDRHRFLCTKRDYLENLFYEYFLSSVYSVCSISRWVEKIERFFRSFFPGLPIFFFFLFSLNDRNVVDSEHRRLRRQLGLEMLHKVVRYYSRRDKTARTFPALVINSRTR